jgi:pantoate--beta-alanine ligase
VQIVRTIPEVRRALAAPRTSGRRIALVPTMGALHEGHLALVDGAKGGGAYVVMSVFVNPLQFAPGEDFERYPRDMEADAAMAGERGVDLIFAPETGEMYAGEPEVTVRAGRLAGDWEGRVRPGHFDGVLTVVAKLFGIVQPDVAWFGQKDLQQALLVRAMTRDLNMPVGLEIIPTVRDVDGLALSSRNRYLSSAERMRALALSGALNAVKASYDGGERDVEELEYHGHAKLLATPGIKIDYMAVVELQTFRRPALLAEAGAAIGAIRVGGTRLIDNVLLGPSTL